MDILKVATDWAKAETFSSLFFILFGVFFISASIGFWQLGKTEFARAYIFPMLVAGILILIVGFGLFFTNKSRISSFETAYQNNPSTFVESEIVRANKTLNEFKTIVFKVIPIIIVLAALLIIFINTPTWRAISITTIAMMIVIILVDSASNARMETYKQRLLLEEKTTNPNQ